MRNADFSKSKRSLAVLTRVSRSSNVALHHGSLARLCRTNTSNKRMDSSNVDRETASVVTNTSIRKTIRRCSTMIVSLGKKTGAKMQRYESETEGCTTVSEVEDLHNREENVENQNALHLACMAYPTVEIIESFMHNSPELFSQRNSVGQTPLHVAAAFGSSPKVVNLLLKAYADAAIAQDHKGRTPLHLACSCKKLCDSGLGYYSGTRDLRKGPSYGVINSLCSAAPKSVNIEDEDGMSALENAIFCESNPKVLRVLHRTSGNAWAGESPNNSVPRRHSMIDLSGSPVNVSFKGRKMMSSVSARGFSESVPLSRNRRLTTVRPVEL